MGKERVSIFIDGSNLYHNLDGVKIDFQKLIKELLKGRKLINCHYYIASLDISTNNQKYWKHQKFLGELRKILGFRVILCKLRKYTNRQGKSGFEIKGDDVHLAVDLVSGAYENLYDIAIIVSGDEDFVPAIKKVRNLGKKVINAYFQGSSSASLKKTCDNFIHMDKITDKLR